LCYRLERVTILSGVGLEIPFSQVKQIPDDAGPDLFQYLEQHHVTQGRANENEARSIWQRGGLGEDQAA
jgi:hypothetical protein